MRPEQWQLLKKAGRRERLEKIPMALIVDSLWIPGYLGISDLDYYLDPAVWFQANLKIHNEFPDIIFVPSWWMEYGMAAEPSALGAKIKFWLRDTPSEERMLFRIEDVDNLWGKQTDIAEVKRRVGHRMCLMGNVNPLEIGVRGTPEEVRRATLKVLEKSEGEGIILSLGGGTSPGMPKQNIIAMQKALEEFNGMHVSTHTIPPHA